VGENNEEILLQPFQQKSGKRNENENERNKFSKSKICAVKNETKNEKSKTTNEKRK
jgi:hypothetical protein